MKHLLFILIIALFASCGGGSSSLDALKKLDSLSKTLESDIVADIPKFNSEDGNFKVNFPGTPKIESQDIPTDIGPIEMQSFTYEKSATEVYMIAYSDYPSELVKQSNPDDLLTGAKEGALTSQGAELESEEKITFDGNPGYFFKAKTGTYFMIYKIFLKENRLYQILMIRDGNYPSQESIDNFIGTFELNS